MKFDKPLQHGKLIRRYKRFIADIRLNDGKTVVCHVPNSGSMMGLAEPGLKVAVSHRPKKSRKLKWTLEMVAIADCWVGVNTSLSNQIVVEALLQGRIRSLRGFSDLAQEVPYGKNSRIDILLKSGEQQTFVEVKNCTLAQARCALFPDAVTLRGQKHLLELMQVVTHRQRGVIFFLVNRHDCTRFRVAEHIDPQYGTLLRQAVSHGVRALAYRTRVTPERIELERKIPILL